MNSFYTQFIGISLAIVTAIGCMAYERLVKSSSYSLFCFFNVLSYLWIWGVLLIFGHEKSVPDYGYIKQYKWPILIYVLSGLTSPLWYWLTKRYSVLVGGIFEIKYIVVLALFAIFFGEQKPNVNTYVGCGLAILSVYFISKK